MNLNRHNKNIEINKFLTLYFNNKDSFSINFLYKDTNKSANLVLRVKYVVL